MTKITNSINRPLEGHKIAQQPKISTLLSILVSVLFSLVRRVRTLGILTNLVDGLVG